RYQVRARPDLPPVVRVTEPEAEVETPPEARLLITGRVEDDFGVSRAAVRWRLQGDSRVREVPPSITSQPHARSAEIRAERDLARTRAQAGNLIEWWVSAWDNREDAGGRSDPQVTESDIRRIRIAQPPDMLAGGAGSAAQPREPERLTSAPASEGRQP